MRLLPRQMLWRVGLPLIGVQVLVFAALFWAAGRQRADEVVLVGALVCCIALTVIILWIASRWLIKRVDQITTQVEQYADGNFDHRLPRVATAELSELSRALNIMADELSRRLSDLEQSQQQERIILRSMRHGVMAVSGDHRILRMNEAALRMFGLEKSLPVRGRLVYEVIRQPQLHAYLDEALKATAPASVEFTIGSERSSIINARAEPLSGLGERDRGVLLVLSDVTELRRLETIRSDFAANVSHELRTPITNLKGYTETLLEVGVEDHEQVVRFLGVIRENVDRLEAIVNDIMSLSRLEQQRSRQEIEFHPTEMASVLAEVRSQYAERAEARDISLRFESPRTLTAEVHSRLIAQAIGNLVSNAINYSPSQTEIAVTAAVADSGELVINVCDQGVGIAAEHIPRLFERFYRVDRGRSRSLGGTGLGLAIVKHIAILHGGRPEVESQIGKGSRFSIILPASAVINADPEREGGA